MKVYRNLEELQKTKSVFPPTIVTSGSFDGVHKGHQVILRRLRQLKTLHPECETAVITFDPHPRKVLKPEVRTALLSTLSEKIKLLEAQGIEHLLILPFTKEFSQTSSETFIQEILIDALKTQHLVIGYDHRFGRDREGGFDYLQENQANYPFSIEEIPRQEVDEMTVSSTRIREALRAGDLPTVERYLGYDYTITGKVVRGQQIGRTLGYPTANIQLHNSDKLLPVDGIYAVLVTHRGTDYQGMLSIGVRPTIGDKLARTIEVNIFDFDQTIYDQELTLTFKAYLRAEEKYDSLEALKTQLAQDKKDTLAFFSL